MCGIRLSGTGASVESEATCWMAFLRAAGGCAFKLEYENEGVNSMTSLPPE